MGRVTALLSKAATVCFQSAHSFSSRDSAERAAINRQEQHLSQNVEIRADRTDQRRIASAVVM